MAWRDSHDTGWMRFLRAVQASFRVGYLFGVEVRVFWLTVILLPLIGALMVGRYAGSWFEVVVLAAIVTVALCVIIWTHEMGHVLAARRYGIRTPLITLSPLGGLAHLGAPPINPRSDIVIALAGPATHLLWLAVFWPLSEIVDHGTLRPEGWTWSPLWFTVDLLFRLNLWLMLFNLLPFLPMDGGRVLRAILSFRLHPNRATIIAARIGMVGAAGFVIMAFVQGEAWSGILLAIGISNFFACRQEIRMARYATGPYDGGGRLEAWESDPDAWKRGGGGTPRREKDRGPDAAEVDRVLDRVIEVGMAGLTKAERKILKRASKSNRS